MTQKIPKQYIASLLPPNSVILEAGAHIGRDTLKMSTLWPKGTIHSFEPVPKLFAQLTERTANTPNIKCYNTALSNTIGSLPFYVSSGRSDACSSLLPPKECLEERPDIVFTEIKTVPVTTIDAWAKEHTIDHIDFMWLDLQGAELRALEGAQKILPTVKVLLIEFNLTERYQDAPLYDQIKTWLQAHDFKLDKEALHHATWGDALFINSAYHQPPA